MLTTLIPIPATARSLAGGIFLTVAGCAGDNLLLPRDGEPAQLRVVSGDQQSAPAGDPVEDPLVVEALDRAGRPVPGAIIIFEFVDQPNGAELSPENVATDEAGRAAAEVTLGTPPGDQSVEARLDDPESDLKVQFRLTAVQGSGGDGGDEGEGGGGDGGNGGGGDDGDDGDDGGGGHRGESHDNEKGKGKGK